MKLKYKILIMINMAIGIFFLLFFTLAIVLPQNSNRVFDQNIACVVEVKAQTGELISFGTAEIISADGQLVTNAHVVTYTRQGGLLEFEEIYIRFAFENEYRPVELIKFDTVLDIALMRFSELPPFNLSVIKIGDSESVKTGDTVYAIGNSMNYGISMTQGIISNPLLEIDYQDTKRPAIQSSLTITEGNSGGALLNAKGELIGITTFRIKDSNGAIVYGLSYSIPIKNVIEFIN